MNLHIRVLHNGLTTKMFSAECGSPLNSSRVATANLVLYPPIIPGYIPPDNKPYFVTLLSTSQNNKATNARVPPWPHPTTPLLKNLSNLSKLMSG